MIPGIKQGTDTLITEPCRSFARWAWRVGGSSCVLSRDLFEPEDLQPWLGRFTIVERVPETGDFRYRLFGMQLAEAIGRDLTGKTFDEWPPNEAAVLREQTEAVLEARTPLTVHVELPVLRYRNSGQWHTRLFEQVVWPMIYSGDEPDAVLKLIVPVDRTPANAPEGLLGTSGG